MNQKSSTLESKRLLEAMNYSAPALLIKRYMRDQEVSEDVADAHFNECKKFLIVCAANPSESYAPSLVVDEMWHSFILFTRQYATFCEVELGCFVHHAPSEGGSSDGYERTVAALQETFGRVEERYWPAPEMKAASCSTPSECGGSGGSGEGGCTSRCTGDGD